MNKIFCSTILLLILSGFIGAVFAQSTNIKLPTTDNTSSFDVLNNSSTSLLKIGADGRVGMGPVTNPRAQLEIGGTEGLLVTGTTNSGTIRALGAGSRMHWYPRKGAFRVGMAESSYWDDDGTSNPRLALYSIAMGYQPRASAVASAAIGAYNQSTGDYSLSLGSYSQATASHAIAIGTQAYATGIYSIAIGSGANTNGRDGAMVIGDDTYFQTAYASADNELTMRFSGGFRLWSSYPDSTSGVYMRHGASGWSNYCDRNKKENFKQLDGEQILKKIHDIPITEWNYKGIPEIRYIGPMAQDLYAAFHLGGDDSLGISTISIDGINMAGVQALEKRTREMRSQLDVLKAENENIKPQLAELDRLKSENEKLKIQLENLGNVRDQLEELKQLKKELNQQLIILKAGDKK